MHTERSKDGEAGNSIILDSKWARWMSQVCDVMHVKNDDRSIWNFAYPAFVKEFQISSKRVDVQVVPYQCRHSGASHDRAVEARPLLEIQKRGQWKSARSVVRYEKSARLGQVYAQYPSFLQAWIETVSPHVEGIVLGLRTAGSLPPCA